MEENEDINVHEKIVQFNSKFNIRISKNCKHILHMLLLFEKKKKKRKREEWKRNIYGWKSPLRWFEKPLRKLCYQERKREGHV